MSLPDEQQRAVAPRPPRYGRYVALLAVVILVLITVNTLVTKPNGVTGVLPGERVPPFAVPLVLGTVEGDADIAVHAHEGQRGNIAACSLRRSGVLNICQLYEHEPVVLALFIDDGSCPNVLGTLQKLVPSFPAVHFAAVSLKGSRSSLRRLVAKDGLTMPVGFDRKGDLLTLYKVATCPQLTFILPGGKARGKALLTNPSVAELRSRIEDLVAASKARSAGV
jgi:hypothetical protein